MRATADTVLEQTWTYTTTTGAKIPLRNIFARFKPNAAERILYVTHWDTRPEANGEFSKLTSHYKATECLNLSRSWVVTGFDTPNPDSRVWVLRPIAQRK